MSNRNEKMIIMKAKKNRFFLWICFLIETLLTMRISFKRYVKKKKINKKR